MIGPFGFGNCHCCGAGDVPAVPGVAVVDLILVVRTEDDAFLPVRGGSGWGFKAAGSPVLEGVATAAPWFPSSVEF